MDDYFLITIPKAFGFEAATQRNDFFGIAQDK
jgi:hypothetical protein